MQQANPDTPLHRASWSDPELPSYTQGHLTDLLRNPRLLFLGTQYVFKWDINKAQFLESVCLLSWSYYLATWHLLWYHFHLRLGWVSNSTHKIVEKNTLAFSVLSFYTSKLQIALLPQTKTVTGGFTRRRGRCDWPSWCFCPMCSS